MLKFVVVIKVEENLNATNVDRRSYANVFEQL